MSTLTAYHGEQKIKMKYLKRIRAHRLADEIVKGQYWEGGKGCAVGCTIHSGEHAAYETELGIPAWVAHLEDYLFENMSNEEAQKWPERLLKAIPVGFDGWDKIEHQYHAWLLADPEAGVLQYAKGFPEAEAAIKEVARLHKRRVKNKDKWFAARSAAESAAWSARSAAKSAESAAESAAWSAARSAESAESAARSAAWSAEFAAWSAESAARSAAESAAWSARSAAKSAESAAESAAVKRQADKLIELLSN